MKSRFTKNAMKIFTLIFTISLTVMCVAGSTVAWMSDSAEQVNTFDSSWVSCEVSETFINETTKSNVQIKNTGDIPAYIRVALAPAWKNGDDIAAVNASLEDCTISINNTDWTLGSDDFYYCKTPIAPGKFTPNLINSCTVKTQNGDFKFELQIIASSIQSDPIAAVKQAWQVVTGADADGKLEVKQ